jgi:penicillin-binding protein 2
VDTSFKTRTDMRVYEFSIPAPRGQITDRYGNPLAVNRLGYNLEMRFPLDRDFTEAEVVNFVQRELQNIQSLTGETVKIAKSVVLKHYRNRPHLPLMLVEDMDEAKVEIIQKHDPQFLNIVPVYFRHYPQGDLAAHVVGYVGLERGRVLGKPEADETLWTRAEGREGIEKAFNDLLTGVDGRLKITTDGNGNITSEGITKVPHPGFNVVTSLDLELQRKAEATLAEKANRGAIVVMDPNSGDVLVLASYPSFDLNTWVPRISPEDFEALRNDERKPMQPRAYGSAYPPGSTFKIITSVAAVESGVVDRNTYLPCPPSLQVGNHSFGNWKDEHMGDINLVTALQWSCNTFFYRAAIQTRDPIIEWAQRLGLGRESGLPVTGESSGRVPTHDYMLQRHGRRLLDGDWANVAIGQGDLLTTPLQMAIATAGFANGRALYQPRLVRQVQTINDEVQIAFPTRPRNMLNISQYAHELVTDGLEAVVDGGTGGRAAVEGHNVAGKTGTAQWGPEAQEKLMGWFVGFAPAEAPQYAFAAIYEGAPREDVGGGSKAAPLIQPVMEIALSRPPKAIPVNSATAEPPERPAGSPNEGGNIPRAVPVDDADLSRREPVRIDNSGVRRAIPLN